MNAKTSGKNHTEPQDQQAVRNVKARTFTEPLRIEDTFDEAVAAGGVGDMDKLRIAVPCIGRGNLSAAVSPHFGRCDSYAIVSLEDEKIKGVESLSNDGHTECAGSVRRLVENGVSLMLVTGMGMRPYLICKQLGIEVRCGITGTVADAVESFVTNKTVPMTEDSLCGHHQNE
jgi:predicted Fe-Mo cluster-binding NifX family protein